MLIFQSSSLDVYRNLAIEEYLMEHVTGQGPVLFLWQSDCAVVMGKNQNPWRECRLDLMRAENVPLARRISGGGTVYHDAGNLNYCVIVDRTRYREQQAYDMVLQALATLGVQAEKTGKSNLSVNGLKFSGNAFCFRKGRALHHGTLLLHTDLERLNRYLGSMFEHIDTRAIPSIPAEVTNLKLDVGALAVALKEQFQTVYGKTDHPRKLMETDIPSDLLEPLTARQAAPEWQYDATPKFTLESGPFKLSVEKGVVTAAVRPEDKHLQGTRFLVSAFSLLCEVD